ncbi:MAG: hypothetical protein HYX56_01460 [Chloroflexi bacterium]|nr:hypothetical protein [Chloroflexota bacterium]
MPESTALSALEVGGRVASFVGIALLIGGAAFGTFVRRTPTPDEDDREQLVLAVGGLALVAGSVALLLDQGGRSPLGLTTLLAIRGLSGVAVLAAGAVLAERHVRVAALAGGIVAAVAATLG